LTNKSKVKKKVLIEISESGQKNFTAISACVIAELKSTKIQVVAISQ